MMLTWRIFTMARGCWSVATISSLSANPRRLSGITCGFRASLQGLPADRRPAELNDVDLANFHYGAWLLERGYDFKTERESTPLFWDYLRFQRRAITEYFGELADYAREYAASKGRSVL